MKRIGYIDARRLSLLDDRAIGLGTDRGVTITPSSTYRGITVASTWTVPGVTGRPLMAQLTTNERLGGWANAFKAYVDLQTKGGASGLLSASCHEVKMATAGIAGNIAAVEMEIVYEDSCGNLPQPCFFWMNTDGDKRGDFDTVGDLFKISSGPTPGAGLFISADTNTLRVGTGADGGVKRYLPLSLSENILHYDVSEIAADGRMAIFTGSIAAPNLGDGAGLFQIQVSLAGAATGAWAVTSTWLNIGDASAVLADGNYVFLHSDGIWQDTAAKITNAFIAFQKYQAILDDSDFTHLHIWNLNLNKEITALFEVNNPANFGFEAGTSHGNVIGTIPLYTTGLGAIKYVAVYGDPGGG